MRAPTIRLLLPTAALLYSLRSCLTDADQSFQAKKSAPSIPSNDERHNHRNNINMYDHSQRRAADTWNDFLRNGREPRKNREPVQVDYMGQHPFEQNTQQDNTQNKRQTQRIPATTYTDESRYQPMRVQFDTHLLDALSNAYPSHVSYVRNVLLPSLRNFWSDTLTIIPATKIEVPLDIPNGKNAKCAQEVKKLSGFDLDDFLQYESTVNARSISNIGTDGNVELGSEGNSLVYNNIDLVVIVIPVEGTDLCPEIKKDDAQGSSQLQTLAFATNCQHDQLDRPTVGYTGICFGPMDPSDRSTKTHKRRLLTIAHEFTHILGMNSYDFPFFYSHATKKPRTPRNDWNRPPEKEVLCVDGTRQTVLTASEDTIKPVTTANGYIAYEVVTETVANVVRNQFDCQKMVGGRLENQPTGDTDCFGSHWDHRLFNNEFMTAVYTGSTQYVTALTLALLEDSGWYRPNYKVAQNSPFALGAGCDFLEDQCIQKGAVPKWAQGTFCDSATSIGCTPDKNLVAYCDISKWDANLPSGYQYFEDPVSGGGWSLLVWFMADGVVISHLTYLVILCHSSLQSVGGGLQQMDFCPAFTTIFRFEMEDGVHTLDCNDPNLNGAWVQVKGEVFGQDSRCIQHVSGARPLCLEVICGKYAQDAGKVVLVVEGGKRMRCSYAGEILRLPTGTDVICPPFEETCPESICPANCAGRGICDYTLSPAQCECFDRSDTSPFCSESPWSFAPTISPAPTISASPTAAPTISPRPTESLQTRSSGPPAW
eukprot:CAMPEP_0201866140 /NCGR_PEP_ID=MMETSP0902-20130614/819_1 /ASSEMBLY_ACC=CAM_ASM_000551 /TAXON_ID=420261 /ORGANISM="Thalassiosira antarctica, Strain CCMP982" /LENGTH=766 /DNA_ID=CAMNT_0048391049 /DNA_START=19 /DNA_END=2317 /DNA_ORIENTATION=-